MRRSWVYLTAVLAVLIVGAGASPASAAPGPCDVVGIPFVPDPVQKACEEVTGAAGDMAVDVAGDAAKAIAAPIFRQATAWVAGGAGWLVGRVGALIDSTTTPRLQSDWFAAQYQRMVLLATALALPLLFLAVIQSAVSRNPAVIARALTAIPVAFVFTGAAVAVVAAMLALTDWACQVISRQTGPHSREFFHDVAAAFGTLTEQGGVAGAGPALFVGMLASILAAFGAFAVWIELLIRSAGIYVCVLFFPAVLVARIWPKLESWARRLAEALTALVLSKFVLIATLSLAAGAMGESRASEGFNGVLAGGALLVFAAFAPLALFRLVQFADVHVHARAGTAGAAVRGAQTTMSAAQAARSAMDRQGAQRGLVTTRASDMARATTAANGRAGGEASPGGHRGGIGRNAGAGPPAPRSGSTSVAARPLASHPTTTQTSTPRDARSRDAEERPLDAPSGRDDARRPLAEDISPPPVRPADRRDGDS